jgi:hypothetical protein
MERCLESCSECGERKVVVGVGTNHSYIVVARGGAWEWIEGRSWISTACAACGKVIAEWHEPLDPPEESRLRALLL